MNSNAQDKLTNEQSVQVIKAMLELSQTRLKSDGILFLVWGWSSTLSYFFLYYLPARMATGYWLTKGINILKIALPVLAILFTAYYLYKQNKRVSTYIGTSIRYVWATVIGSMVAINLIQFNILGEINFELQHPIFMILIAFGTIMTGSMIRYKLIVVGGVVFGLLAFAASYFELQDQLLIESIAWLIAFVVPGHILFAQRNK